jgi:ribokinase
VVVTSGKHGSWTASDGDTFATPAFDVPVVDTTGAGDVFHGGFLYGLLQDWDLPTVARFAAATAALKCRKLGGRAGIPSLSEVMSFLQYQDRDHPQSINS